MSADGTRRSATTCPAGSSGSDLPRRLRLIVITDRGLAGPRGPVAIAEAALRAGAPAIQFREKHLPPRDALPAARRIRAAAAARGALFFVNDRIDLALAVRADGIHLGPGDLPVQAARRIAPPGFLIGYSTNDPDRARRAVSRGADYIGCGAIYPTRTKIKAECAIGLRRLAQVASAVRVPVVAIGGLTPDRAPEVMETGAAGCAVVGAVMAAGDPARAVHAFLAAATPAPRAPSRDDRP